MKIKWFVRILFVFLSMVLLLMGCRPEPSQEQVPSTNTNTYGNQDTKGNIYIVNQSKSNLLFYYEDEGNPKLLKKILKSEDTSNIQPFLVHVPTDGNESKVLEIWEEGQVDNFLAPQSTPYRKWTVVLSSLIEDESKRYIWVVKDGTSTGTGSVSFSYEDFMLNGLKNSYSVDVFLDSQTGSKIASIAPDTTDKQIGLEYDTYSLFFRYWFSDPDFYDGEVKEVGWISSDEAVTLSSIFNEQDVQVPTYWDSSVGKTGKLQITNLTNSTVTIFADNDSIEKYVISNQPTANISNLPGGKGYTLTLLEDQYDLAAKKYIDGSAVSSLPDIDLVQNYTFSWSIGSTSSTQSIAVKNNTNAKISVHDDLDGSYLGFVIEPNKERTIIIDEAISNLRFMDLSKSNSGARIDCTSGQVTVNTLQTDDFTGPELVSSLNLTAGVGFIDLSWVAPRDSDFSKVRVMRGTSDFPATPKDKSAKLVYEGNATSYKDSGLVSGTKYYYSVFSFDDKGNSSSSASTASETVLSPSNVTNLVIIPKNTQVNLSWTNPTDVWFSKVKVVRNTKRQPVNVQDGTEIYEGKNSSFIDTALTNGNRYYYGVYALDSVSNVSTGVFDSVKPNTTLTAPAEISSFNYERLTDKVVLKWTNPTDTDFKEIIIVKNDVRTPISITDGTRIYDGAPIKQYSDIRQTDVSSLYYYKIFTVDEEGNISNGIVCTVSPPFPQYETKSGSTTSSSYSYVGVELPFTVPKGTKKVTMNLKVTGYFPNYYVNIYANGTYIGQPSVGTSSDQRTPSGWTAYVIPDTYWNAGNTLTIKTNAYSYSYYTQSYEIKLTYE